MTVLWAVLLAASCGVSFWLGTLYGIDRAMHHIAEKGWRPPR